MERRRVCFAIMMSILGLAAISCRESIVIQVSVSGLPAQFAKLRAKVSLLPAEGNPATVDFERSRLTVSEDTKTTNFELELPASYRGEKLSISVTAIQSIQGLDCERSFSLAEIVDITDPPVKVPLPLQIRYNQVMVVGKGTRDPVQFEACTKPTITATAALGSCFDGWSSDECVISLNQCVPKVQAKSITAKFSPSPWQPMVPAPPTGKINAFWGEGNELLAVGDDGIVLKLDLTSLVWTIINNADRRLPNLKSVWKGKWTDSKKVDHNVIWAVGTQKQGFTSNVLKIHTDNTPEQIALSEKNLNGVFGLIDNERIDVWVIGDNNTIFTYSNINNNSWSMVKIPIINSNLNGTWAFSRKKVWIVGDRGTLASWDSEDNTFQQAASPSPIVDIVSISGSGPDNIWAVGKMGVMMRWDGSNWIQKVAGSPALPSLTSVWIDPQGGWAVGGGGTILRLSNDTWASVCSGTDKTLNAVWTSPTGISYLSSEKSLLRNHPLPP